MAVKPTCWFADFSDADCEGQMDRCHLIPKQRLRIRHIEDVWDRALWAWGCRRHHTLFDHKFLELKREDLPESLELWAQANRFTWSLDRDYGAKSDANYEREMKRKADATAARWAGQS